MHVVTNPRAVGNSLWYRWTAPASGGWFTFDLTSGTPFDSLLAIYTGNQFVAGNDDYQTSQSRVSFAAAAGMTYSIVVAGKNSYSLSGSGAFQLSWYPTPLPSFVDWEFVDYEFDPTSGYPGRVITLWGTNFTGATRVLFNGTSAQFSNVAVGYGNFEDIRLFATVPLGATAGPITIETPHGNAMSSVNFTPLALPPVRIRELPEKLVELSWPVTGVNFQLHEFNGFLAPRFLVSRHAAAVTKGGQISVTVPAMAPQQILSAGERVRESRY